MARPALATRSDLEARLGATLPVSQYLQADARLADASEIVRAYAGKTWLNEAGDALEGVPEQIAGVVASMVERATRNPDGTTAETAGPFSRSFGVAASDRLYMTKSEKMVVRAAAGRLGLGSISTTRGPLETASVDDPYMGGSPRPEDTYSGITSLMGGT